MEGGLWPIFVVAMNDARGNEIARELLAGAGISHESGESADDRWMLYYVTTERLPDALFWLEDLSRFVSGEVRPVHSLHQQLIDEVCESPAPHRAARRLAEAHERREVSAGLISKPATVSTRILGQLRPASVSGIVSVTTIESSAELVMRSMAGPDSTACVQ